MPVPLADRPAPLTVTDLSELPGSGAGQRWRAAIADLAASPFDLASGPLVTASLMRVSHEEHVLCLVAHRIVLDEASLELVLDELSARYAGPPGGRAGPARAAGPAAAGPDWFRLGSDEQAHRLDYWAERLSGAGQAELPADRPRPSAPGGSTGRVLRPVPARIAGRLPEAEGTGPFPFFCAALIAVLARYTGQPVIVFGTTMLPDSGGPRWIGDLGDLAAIGIDVADDPAFADLIARVRQQLVGARRHRAPFHEVVRRFGGRRSRPGHPIARVAVDQRRADAGGHWPAGLTALAEPEPAPASAFDLHLVVLSGGQALELRLDYAAELFDAARISRLLDHLVVLAGAAVDQPATQVSRLPILTERERELLTSGWQGPVIGYSRDPVHQQVRRQARARPWQLAAKLADQSLTYGELDRQADALARHLRARGLRPEEIVGIALERGLEVFIAALAVLKAGGAFVIIDPTHPPRRVEFIMADTAARFLLTAARHLPQLPEPGSWAPVCLDRDQRMITEQAVTGPLAEWAHHDSLAYVLYTSGSTGQPKGVLVEHGALSNFLLWMTSVFDLGPADRILQHMALIFDFAEGEMFTALTAGATMILVPESVRASGAAIGDLLTGEKITYIGGPPAMLAQVPAAPYADLRAMIFGGEAFPGDLVNRWNAAGRRVVNGYGPTEAAVGCIYYECEHRHWTTQPPIGRAMPNRYAYIVDGYDNLAPVGVPGEILVAGAGLARGYLNQPDLTRDRFIADPFRPGGRAYRTGDLGVWTQDGQIQFLGRIDSQIKLNGLRIELEEIDVALGGHPSVLQAATALCGDAAGTQRLVGYVVLEGAPPTAAELRAHLTRDLPAYMVPAQFVVLDGLPLTSVGKIDRSALPAPGGLGPESAAFVPARTAAERRIADIFCGVLDLDRISVHDDFFELGGHSLALLRATARIRSAVGVPVPLAAVDAAPTVSAVAALIERLIAESVPGADQPAADAAIAAALLTEIEAMSDEDVSRRLDQGDQ